MPQEHIEQPEGPDSDLSKATSPDGAGSLPHQEESATVALRTPDQDAIDAIYQALLDSREAEQGHKESDLLALATVLSHRGVDPTPEGVHRHLHPDLDSSIGDPLQSLSQMSELCDRVIAAVEAGKSIAVYCDYDVDGTTAAAQVIHYLRSTGVETGHFVSDRLGSGYGVSVSKIDEIADAGYDVVFCLDQGSSAAPAMAQAKARGLETLVIDHHGCGDDLSNIDAHVNPAQPGCGYNNSALCASGLANTFLRAMDSKWDRETEKGPNSLLAFAALGTVCDVMPLNAEVNRAIVQQGLCQVAETPFPGLQALSEAAGITGNPTATEVAFQIGPLMNAASRIEHADILLDLLTTDSLEHARGIAQHLVELRGTVRQEVSRITEEIEERLVGEDPPAIAMGDTSWNPGVIGIVSGRLAERYGVPVCLMGGDLDGTMTASGRSPEGYSLPEIFSSLGENLIRGGGHPAAAGGRVLTSALDEFCDAFVSHVRTMESPDEDDQAILGSPADLSLALPEIGFRLLETLALGEPYGHQNPAPSVLIEELEVAGTRTIKDQHLSVKLSDGKQTLPGFKGQTTEHPALIPGNSLSVTGTLSLNEYGGGKSIQLYIDNAVERPKSPESEDALYYQPQSEIVDVETPRALARMVEDLSHCEVLVVDVETVWDSLRGTHICLAQIFDPRKSPEGNKTYLVDGVTIEDLSPLGLLLENPDIEIIEHNSGFENARFSEIGISQNNISDTLDLAVTLLPHLPNHKLQTVASYLLGVDMTKGEQVSDWSARPLSLAQRKYGTVDVEITWQIHTLLKVLEEQASTRFEELQRDLHSLNDYARALSETAQEIDSLEHGKLQELLQIDENVSALRGEINKRILDGELACDFEAGHARTGGAKKTFSPDAFTSGLIDALTDTPHSERVTEIVDAVSFVKSQSIKEQLEELITEGFPLNSKQIQPLLRRCMVELSPAGNHTIKPLFEGTDVPATDLTSTLELSDSVPGLLTQASASLKERLELADNHERYKELLVRYNYLLEEIRERVEAGERYSPEKDAPRYIQINKSYPVRGISVPTLRDELESLVADDIDDWRDLIQQYIGQADGYIHSGYAKDYFREADLNVPTYPILHNAWIPTGQRHSPDVYISAV